MTGVSIIIPTCDRPALLPRAVASALAACPEDGAVIVVDDGRQHPAAETLASVRDARLRVVTNGFGKGASGARNQGAAVAAGGSLLFFLDDDDTMLPDYCRRILDTALPAGADYGFATVGERWGDAEPRLPPESPSRLLDDSTPLRRRIGATSSGFWIRAPLFAAAGGLDPALVIDEDTDLCCRLIAAGHSAWFSGRPGTIVTRAEGGASLAGQLTGRSNTPEGAACYLRSYTKNRDAFARIRGGRWFLLSRYLRRAVRAGAAGDAWRALAHEPDAGLRAAGRAFLAFKIAAAKASRMDASRRPG